jgi:hypothetical protein
MADNSKPDEPSPAAGPYSGSVTIKDKAGVEEAALLSVRAMQEAASAIVETVAGLSKDQNRILVLSPQDVPNGVRLAAFRFELSVLSDRLESASNLVPASVSPTAVTTKAVEGAIASRLGDLTPKLVSTQLGALNELLGYFKSNYTVGSIETTIEDSLLVKTVVGALLRKGRRALLPGLLHRAGDAAASLQDEIGPLFALRDAASQRAISLSAGTDAISKAEVQAITAAVTAFDTYVTSLSTAGQNGASPLAGIIDDLTFEKASGAADLVLLVHVENCGGSFYDKTGLFAGIFSMPLYFAGGTTISYAVTSGSEGELLAAGAVPTYGGFVKADKLREALKGPIPEDPPLFQRLW